LGNMGILRNLNINPGDYSGLLQRAKGKRVVVLLSSGGLRIVCHLPLLRLLEILGLPVDELWGVSAGSIAGGLWASGRGAADIEDEILSVRRSQIYEFFLLTGLRAIFPSKNAEKAGLITGKKLERYVSRLIGQGDNPLLDIHNLKVLAFNRSLNRKAVLRIGDQPETIVIEIDGAEQLIVENGSLSDILRASFSTPVMFRPKRLNGMYYVDGGLVENYPVLSAFNHYISDVEAGRENRGLLMLGVNIGYSGEFVKTPTNLLNSIAESYDIVGHEQVRLQLMLLRELTRSRDIDCDLITIQPGIFHMPLADFKQVPSAIQTALECTVSELSSIE